MIQVDTSNILMIVGGAFAGLDKVIRQRTEKQVSVFMLMLKPKMNQASPNYFVR